MTVKRIIRPILPFFFLALGATAGFHLAGLWREPASRMTETGGRAEHVRTGRLIILDPQGRSRASLTMPAGSTAEAGAYDEKGEYRIRMNAVSSLELLDGKRRPRARLEMTADGPLLRVFDENTVACAKLAIGKLGPGLVMFDENGKTRVGVGVIAGKPRLDLMDEGGLPCASLTMAKDGPALTLLEKNGEIAATLGVDRSAAEKPGLALYDRNGAVVWSSGKDR